MILFLKSSLLILKHSQTDLKRKAQITFYTCFSKYVFFDRIAMKKQEEKVAETAAKKAKLMNANSDELKKRLKVHIIRDLMSFRIWYGE